VSKSAPAPPDYNAAAQTQAQSSAETLEAQTVANRPNINTPFGSQTWQMQPQIDPVTGKPVSTWTQNTTLTPAMQQALEAEQGITSTQAGLAKDLLGQEVSQEKTPIDMNAIMGIAPTPSAAGINKGAADATFGMFENYQAPLMKQARDQLDTQLQNQGLKPGDQAYDTAMRNLENQQSMSTLQAENQSVLTGADVGQKEFGEALSGAQYQDTASQIQLAQEMQKRGFTLNQIQAILTGNQVGLPATPGFATAGASQPVQALTAAEAQNQANLGAFGIQQQQTAGAEAGAGSLAMAAAIFF
jgi:hypothetical protein